MSEEGLARAQQKMREDGAPEVAINVFTDYYHQVEEGATGLIPESTIEPLLDPPFLADVQVDAEAGRQALDATVMIKLNGGLGTSMGLDNAKTLLPVRDGLNFLDVIARQVLGARRAHGVRLPLLFMNSFRTRKDTLAHLDRYPELAIDGLPLDFVQNREPKLTADTLEPVSWPDKPALEWCPPGHGDLYIALYGSGLLDRLIEAGYRFANISNGDNLGAAPDPTLAGWFAESGADYAAEICRRTVNDRKGGHLAIRKSDGHLILRDTAQTPKDDLQYFMDEKVHPFFHCNNLWFNLEVLRDKLVENDGVMGLPLMPNHKTVDPSDKTSPEVIQLESGMGTSIEVFDKAAAICVGRERFLPVKTTNELLLVQSDLYRLDDLERLTGVGPEGQDGDNEVRTAKEVKVDLDDVYKLVGDFTERIPHQLSLLGATSFTVEGDWRIGRNVRAVDDAVLGATESQQQVEDGATIGPDGIQ